MGPSSGGRPRKAPPLTAGPCDPVVLRGISPPFGGLSPSRGQVAHVLRTRSPLYSRPEGRFLARLACLRHAANIRSEPGSNPSIKKRFIWRTNGPNGRPVPLRSFLRPEIRPKTNSDPHTNIGATGLPIQLPKTLRRPSRGGPDVHAGKWGDTFLPPTFNVIIIPRLFPVSSPRRKKTFFSGEFRGQDRGQSKPEAGPLLLELAGGSSLGRLGSLGLLGLADASEGELGGGAELAL